MFNDHWLRFKFDEYSITDDKQMAFFWSKVNSCQQIHICIPFLDHFGVF